MFENSKVGVISTEMERACERSEVEKSLFYAAKDSSTLPRGRPLGMTLSLASQFSNAIALMTTRSSIKVKPRLSEKIALPYKFMLRSGVC